MSAGTDSRAPDPMHFWEVWVGCGSRGFLGRPDRAVVLLQKGGADRHAWKGAGEKLGAEGYHAVASMPRPPAIRLGARRLYGQDVMVEDLERVVAALAAPSVLVGPQGEAPAWLPWARITSTLPRWHCRCRAAHRAGGRGQDPGVHEQSRGVRFAAGSGDASPVTSPTATARAPSTAARRT